MDVCQMICSKGEVLCPLTTYQNHIPIIPICKLSRQHTQ